MISKYLFSIFTLIVFNLGTAAVAQQFPASILDCIDRGACTPPVLVSPPILEGFGLMDQYWYTVGAGRSKRFLYRYSVGETSGFQGMTDNGFSPSSTQAVFSGDVWLSANESYDLNVGGVNHQMTLYTDQISGGDNIGFNNTAFRGDITLRLSSEALLAGGGSFYIDDISINGGLDSDGPLICLSEGCFIEANFNLVNVNYEQVGDLAVTGPISSFPMEGQLLYSQESGFPGFNEIPSEFFNQQSSLFVGTPVPILLGDCNLDGTVDFMDISWMIQFLMSGEYIPQADCNQDVVVNFSDIAPFIAILSNN